MRKGKKFLSILLMLCMMLSLLPSTVFAVNSKVESPFKDVHEGDWFFESVKYVYENKIMNGTGNQMFSPNAKTNRGMIVTVLHRLEGSPNTAGSLFDDVKSEAYYATAVSWASQNGVVEGYGNRLFGPDDPITREQMAAMLFRYSGFKGYDVSQQGDISAFQDNGNVSNWATGAVKWAYAEGLLTGKENGILDPGGTATRAEVATIIMRFLTRYGGAGSISVQFNSCGGSSVASQKLQPGEKATEPDDPTRDGFIFSGWYLEDAGEPYDFSVPVQRNIILHAQWAEQTNGTDTVYAYDERHVATELATSYIDNIVLAMTKPNLTNTQKNAIASSIGGTVVGSMTEVTDILQIRVPVSTLSELKKLAEEVSSHTLVYAGFVDFIQDHITDSSPYQDTDPWGGFGIFAKNDWWAEAINAYDAWKTYGNQLSDITVGIMDSGFDTSHEDLALSFPNDTYREENLPDSHGTSVAGLIGAKNNDVGGCGVAYHASLMCVGFEPLSRTMPRTIDWFNAYNALLRAGAKIINQSAGHYYITEDTYLTSSLYAKYRENGISYVEFQNDTIQTAAFKGVYWGFYTANTVKKGWDVLFVQSAGNGENNSGPGVDAKYGGFWRTIDSQIAQVAADTLGLSETDILSHILVVGGVMDKKDSDGNYYMTSYSNYGDTVTICAPGGNEDIYTTDVGGYTKTFSGTSAAAPIVSGAAAFVWSINPNLTAAEVRDILLKNHTVNAVANPSVPAQGTKPMLDLSAAADAAASTLARDTIFLQGKVTDNASIPLSGVKVTAIEAETGETITTMTDPNGQYEFVGKATYYNLRYEKEGYSLATATLDIREFKDYPNWPLTLILNSISLLPLSTVDGQTISGIVLDSNTLQPVAGIKVQFFSEMHYEKETETVVTDANGRFTFTGKTIIGDWWSLSVEETDEYKYTRDDNPTAEGYNTIDTFTGYLYVSQKEHDQ